MNDKKKPARALSRFEGMFYTLPRCILLYRPPRPRSSNARIKTLKKVGGWLVVSGCYLEMASEPDDWIGEVERDERMVDPSFGMAAFPEGIQQLGRYHGQ